MTVVQLLVAINAMEAMILGKIVTYPRFAGRRIAIEPHETPWQQTPQDFGKAEWTA